MHKPSLESARLVLRPVQPSDVTADYCAWMNDVEVTRFTESRFHPPSLDRLAVYVSEIAKKGDQVFLAIVEKVAQRHIGNVKLGPINGLHRFADMGILIGDKREWGKGYATEAIQLTLGHAFAQLKLHKVTASCYVDNVGSIKAFSKAGFVREGVKRAQYLSDGRYVDAVLFGILKDEWRDGETRHE